MVGAAVAVAVGNEESAKEGKIYLIF